MFTVVGSCPKCGAPIYAPSVWQGVCPAPSKYTCMCNTNAEQIYTTVDTWGNQEVDNV